MPRVGNERFPYTRAGQKAARRRARETGQPVSGGGSRGQGNTGYTPHTPVPGYQSRVRPRAGNAIGQPPRSLPPVPGRSAGPSKRGLPVGPGTTNAIQRPKGWWTGEAGPGGVPGPQFQQPLPYPGKTGINPPSPVPPGPPGYGGATIPPRPPGFSKGPGLAPPRTDNRGGSRVMKNPGLSGRPSGKMPGVGPGRRQRRKGGIGGGY